MNVIVIRHCEDPANKVRAVLLPDQVEDWVKEQKAAEWEYGGWDPDDPDDVAHVEREFDFESDQGFVSTEAQMKTKL